MNSALLKYMELMQCFEPGCKNQVEYACSCTSTRILSCELHFGKHLKLSDKAHTIERIFEEPYQGTKEAILEFLIKKDSKYSKMKEKILTSFSQHLLQSENEIRQLLKNLDSVSAEINSYFIEISQTQKLLKSEQNPILGLLTLQPDEAIEKFKKIMQANQELSNSEKWFCRFSEKIERLIECFIKDKFEAYLNSRLSNIENIIEEHNKIISSANEEHKTILDFSSNELANTKDSEFKSINESQRDLKDW